MTNFADRAAPLLAQGIPVFPCREQPNGKNPNGKNPRTRNGFKDATTEAGQVADWAAQWPDALVGERTLPISIFENTKGAALSKHCHLDAEGKLVKEAAANLTAGRVQWKDYGTLAELARDLLKLPATHAIAFGRCQYPTADIRSERELPNYTGTGPVVTRKAGTFTWPAGPGVMLIDYDPPPNAAPLKPGELVTILRSAVPELVAVTIVIKPSTTSCLQDTKDGREVTGIKGQHAFIGVADASRIPAVGKLIADRLWLAGYGYVFISKAGTMHPRTIADEAVWQPERLVFGRADCSDGLRQRFPAPFIYPGEVDALLGCESWLDPDMVKPLTGEQRDTLAARIAEAKRAAQPEADRIRDDWEEAQIIKRVACGGDPEAVRASFHQARALGAHVMPGELVLYPQSGAPVTVAEVLADPGRWHGERFADPFEPDYRGDCRIAVAYLKDVTEPHIFCHAHGGVRYLFRSEDGRLAEIADAFNDESTEAGATEPPLHAFYAYLPAHQYLHRPTRAFWPAASVDGNFPIKIDKLKASQWLDKHRAVQQATWHPGHAETINDKIVVDGGFIHKPGMTIYNRYRAPSIIGGDAHGATRWRDHLRAIYPNEADHIERWLAQRIQRPADKINHALVLGGAQGIGKDSILEPARRGVGTWNWRDIDPKRLVGTFNPWVEAVVLRINEARDLGDIDRFAFYDHSKTYIAAPPDVLICNDKHAKEYPVFNVMGVVITTNHKTNGIYLPPDDRRHYVAWSESKKEDFVEDYWREFWSWLDKGGAGNVVAYLRGLDLRDFNAKAPPPKTEAFFAIVQANANPDDVALSGLLTNERGEKIAATTLEHLLRLAFDSEFNELASTLQDPKSRRRIPHMMERAGYVSVRNPDANDGLWRINERRQVAYADAALPVADRIRQVRALVGSGK